MSRLRKAFEANQDAINSIGDETLRNQAQAWFNSFPSSNAPGWQIASYSGNLGNPLPATTTHKEVERIYRENANKNIPAAAKVSYSSNFIKGDIYYKHESSNGSQEKGSWNKYTIGTCNSNSSFGVETKEKDLGLCKDKKGKSKEGIFSEHNQYRCVESRIDKERPCTTIYDTHRTAGLNKNLDFEERSEGYEKTLQGGELTEIVKKQTKRVEGEPRKEKIEVVKAKGKNYEKSTTKQNVVSETFEKGTLAQNESLDSVLMPGGAMLK